MSNATGDGAARRADGRGYAAASGAILFAAILLVAAVAGCASSDEYNLDADAAPDDADLSDGVKAAIEISYRRPGDALEFASVTKYVGADVLSNQQRATGRITTTVRFDGGVPVWELRASRGLGSGLTSLIGVSNHRVTRLRYGQLPAGFNQITPGSGSPQPLERGAFYVFEVERESGSTSYQAVKVRPDGTLESYNAQPRAGSSFELCCNLSVNFAEGSAPRPLLDDTFPRGP
jgi:hypothetical protein